MPDRTLLSPDTVTESAAAVPEWTCDGKVLSRPFQLGSFAAAVEFVNRIARIAEEMDHHPDIDIRWRTVALILSTHSAGGLTALDFEAAGRINAALSPS